MKLRLNTRDCYVLESVRSACVVYKDGPPTVDEVNINCRRDYSFKSIQSGLQKLVVEGLVELGESPRGITYAITVPGVAVVKSVEWNNGILDRAKPKIDQSLGKAIESFRLGS